MPKSQLESPIPLPHLRRAVAEFIEDPATYHREPDLVLELTGETWARLYPSTATADELVESGDLVVSTGDASEAAHVIGLFDRYDPCMAMVIPPRTLVQEHM